MQSFPAVLRISQAVSTLAGARDSLAAINTTELSPNCIVMCLQNNSLYVLRKSSTATAASPDIIAPAQGGPGRWYKYGVGATYFQAVSVPYAAIPPQSSVEGSATVNGAEAITDIIVFNVTSTAIPTGVTITNPRVTNIGQGTFRFTNVTAATVAAATATLEVAVLKG